MVVVISVEIDSLEYFFERAGRWHISFKEPGKLLSNSRFILEPAVHEVKVIGEEDKRGAIKKSPNVLSDTSLNSASSTHAHSESFRLLTETPHLRCKTYIINISKCLSYELSIPIINHYDVGAY